MKSFLKSSLWLLLGSLLASGLSAASATLALTDLVNRSDRWPATITLQREYKFNGGRTASKGQVVRVLEFDGREITVDAGRDLVFGVNPPDTNFLAAANQAWAKLTPAQRNLDEATVVADASLWPLKVTCSSGFRLDNGTDLAPGLEYELVSLSNESAVLYSRPHRSMLQANLSTVDAVARARALVVLPEADRPARIPQELAGNLVDSSGKPVTPAGLKDTKIFLLYYGASWCPPCRQFSPSLVEFVKQAGPQNPKLTVVMMSNDKVDAELYGYMTKEAMPWPAMLLSRLNQSPSLLSYTKTSIPQLVIVDRYGRVLGDAYKANRYMGPKYALQTLTKILDSGAAR